MTKYKSNFEARIKKSYPSGLKYEDRKLDYTVAYTYKPDYSLTTKKKHKILIECKGGNSFRFFNSSARKKWISMYNQLKDKHDIRLICEKDFKLNKGSKMTISQWCEKHGVKYHIGSSVPKSWTEE